MDLRELAYYIEQTNGISKPWLLVQLRLKKLQMEKDDLSAGEYLNRLADIHQDLVNLGEWWVNLTDEDFRPGASTGDADQKS
ncbi:hypothetical protein [Anthocerotibacter panamensis]|uniref:hypothetical protein n=1 Tax=Anthocerotibacter panamensis TaxID=2857077 RepID=UPI001C404482|nr:hypothetical protein [Anthocerotibacter panamensis]